MVEADPLAVRMLAKRAASAWRAQSGLLLIVIAVDATPQIALEFAPGDWTRASAFLSLLTLYLQLLVTIRTTALIGVGPPGYTHSRWTEGRYSGAFLLSLLTVFAILAGLALFVVPGVLLLTLWSLALPALVAERLGVTDAMRHSGRLVRPRLARLLAINLIWLLPYATVLGTMVAIIYATDADSPAITAVFDLLVSILLMTGALVWAVVYGAACEAETATA